MDGRVRTLVCYGLHLALVLLTLFLQQEVARMVALGALLLVLAAFLVIISREPQLGVLQILALSLIVLTAPYVLFRIKIETTGVTYLYGAALILASFTLFIVEILADWKVIDWFDRFFKKEESAGGNENGIEELEALPEPMHLLAKGGTDIYHAENCRTIAQTKIAELIQFSSKEEAEGLGLKPCKVCRP